MERCYSIVFRGSQRRKVVKALDRPKIPTQIKGETKLSLNNVSDVLRLLEKEEIVVCKNPKEKTGRIYQLTPKGMKVREELIK